MRFSLNWLKDYVDIKETPEKLANILMMHSFEVEGVNSIGNGLDNIVVGLVETVEKHPNADKLRVCKVNVGKGKSLTIICGATNVAKGQKVPVALVGAELPNGLKIEKRELRGIESSGMICSATELGLEEKSAGIMDLDSQAKVGQPIADVLGLKDVLFDVAILPNRAHDCLSYLGMAREIGALTSRKIKSPLEKIKIKKDSKLKTEKFVDVAIKEKKLCSRYMLQIIEGVKVSSSPTWMQARLQAAGVKCINNIVDITNFVLLETGQPLHAFDYAKISKKKILARKAEKGEKLVALDNEIYELNGNNVVIADGEKPIALAGVIGGTATAVDENTSIIALESANFDYRTIRKTSRDLGISTDSSERFGKDIDVNLAEAAMARATALIQELAGGRVAGTKVDIYPEKIKPKKISISASDVHKIAGVVIKESDIANILKRLDLPFKKSGKVFQVTAPTVRKDLAIMPDLAEEIIRLYGYENIKAEMPKEILDFTWGSGNLSLDNNKLDLKNYVKDILTGVGFSEVWNYIFTNKSLFGADLIKVANPMQQDQSYLRDSLVNNILKNVSLNLKFYPELRIYEMGKVFPKGDDEKTMLCGAVVIEKNSEVFFVAKSIVDLLGQRLNIDSMEFSLTQKKVCPYHLHRSAQIRFNGKEIGICAEIHPQILKDFDIEKKVAIFEIDFDKLAEIAKKEDIKYKTIVKYPTVELDLAIVVLQKILWQEIKDIVAKEGGKLVKKIELFDYFADEKKLGAGKKSLAFHIVYQADNRTLTSEEVQKIQNKIILSLEKFGAEIRK